MVAIEIDLQVADTLGCGIWRRFLA